MFLNNEDIKLRKDYVNTLKAVGAISNLFSESNSPYLSYRAVENIFCKCLYAKNLSRSDCSADASKNNIGFGIKTFLNGNGKTLQKVAEFNAQRDLYKNKEGLELINIISKLRNERISSTKRIHNLTDIIYHCVVREENKIIIFECPMDEINIEKIKIIKIDKNTILFKDDKNEYSFNTSKSTLYKRFLTTDVIESIYVDIVEDPYSLLKNTIFSSEELLFQEKTKEKEFIFLPLFSDRGKRHVQERSGLNQWNAAGRKRNVNEIYIPIPQIINKKFPDFFPRKDIPFNLILPNGNILSAKVCQDGNKALMSNPNSALGEWLLREVLNLKEKELLTYEKLKILNIDSVVIYKDDNGYSIDFTELGSYDDFLNNL